MKKWLDQYQDKGEVKQRVPVTGNLRIPNTQPTYYNQWVNKPQLPLINRNDILSLDTVYTMPPLYKTIGNPRYDKVGPILSKIIVQTGLDQIPRASSINNVTQGYETYKIFNDSNKSLLQKSKSGVDMFLEGVKHDADWRGDLVVNTFQELPGLYYGTKDVFNPKYSEYSYSPTVKEIQSNPEFYKALIERKAGSRKYIDKKKYGGNLPQYQLKGEYNLDLTPNTRAGFNSSSTSVNNFVPLSQEQLLRNRLSQSNTSQPVLSQARPTTPFSRYNRVVRNQQFANTHPYANIDEQGDLSPAYAQRTMEGVAFPNTQAATFDRGLNTTAERLDQGLALAGIYDVGRLGIKGLTSLSENVFAKNSSGMLPSLFGSVQSQKPLLNNPEATNVYKNFLKRINTPEGKQRLANLGITDTRQLKYLNVVGDESKYAYYSPIENIIGVHPELPEISAPVRHELEHAVQSAYNSSKYNEASKKRLMDIIPGNRRNRLAQAFLDDKTEIDHSLRNLELKNEPEFLQTTSAEELKNEGIKPEELIKNLRDEKIAGSYFKYGSAGREKAPFLAEVQQYMMDRGMIPKNSYVNITPDMVEDVYYKAMRDKYGYGTALRIFNIMKPTASNYKLLADNLNKMLGVVPAIGVGASLSNQKKYGGVIEDNRGQWAHPGKITKINSNNITMKGVPYPVIGVSNTGHTQYMMPGQEYQYDGDYVTEYPMMQGGGDTYWRTGKPMVNDPSMDAISKVLLNRNQDKNFMQRAAGFGYQGGIPTKYIEGQDPESIDTSSLLMSSSDNYVYPTITQTAPSQLSYQPEQTNEYINTPSWDIADYFATKGYKRAANDMYKMNYAQGGEMIKRADGSYSRRGLWDNIRANRGSGKKPTKQMLDQEHKIKAQMAFGGQFLKKYQDTGEVKMQPTYASSHVYNNPVKTFPCQGKGCSEQVSDELVSMGLTPQRTDAWFMNDAVKRSGGKEIWKTGSGDINYNNIRIGDIVSLDRPGRHHGKEMKKNPNKFVPERDVEHVGVVVGFNKDGIPMIKHGGADEATVVQPMTNLFLDVLSTGYKLNYKPYSIYRTAKAENFEPGEEYTNRYLRDYSQELQNIKPLSFLQNTTVTPKKKRFIDALNKNIEAEARNLNLSAQEAQELQKVAFGIFGNESKFGESKKLQAKELAKRIIYGFRRAGNAFGVSDLGTSPSLGDTRLKYDDLSQDGTTKIGKLFNRLGVNPDKITGLYASDDYNDEVNATMSVLANNYHRLREKDENGNYKYNFNPKNNTVFGDVPIGQAVAKLYNAPSLIKHYDKDNLYAKNAYSHIVNNLGTLPFFPVNIPQVPISHKKSDDYVNQKTYQDSIKLPEKRNSFSDYTTPGFYAIGGQSTLNPMTKPDRRNWLEFLKY